MTYHSIVLKRFSATMRNSFVFMIFAWESSITRHTSWAERSNIWLIAMTAYVRYWHSRVGQLDSTRRSGTRDSTLTVRACWNQLTAVSLKISLKAQISRMCMESVRFQLEITPSRHILVRHPFCQTLYRQEVKNGWSFRPFTALVMTNCWVDINCTAIYAVMAVISCTDSINKLINDWFYQLTPTISVMSLNSVIFCVNLASFSDNKVNLPAANEFIEDFCYF